MKLRVVMHPADEGGFWAEIPALPGCVSEGDSYDETLNNIREAAEGWLAVADPTPRSTKGGKPVPYQPRATPEESDAWRAEGLKARSIAATVVV
jgi:predicted RNase H-like HicB family nuclease